MSAPTSRTHEAIRQFHTNKERGLTIAVSIDAYNSFGFLLIMSLSFY
jgi:hypothetical protein